MVMDRTQNQHINIETAQNNKKSIHHLLTKNSGVFQSHFPEGRGGEDDYTNKVKGTLRTEPVPWSDQIRAALDTKVDDALHATNRATWRKIVLKKIVSVRCHRPSVMKNTTQRD